MENAKSLRIFLVSCSGFQDIYVVAPSFDDAREKWLNEYINIEEETLQPTPEGERICPMPDTIAYITDYDCVITPDLEDRKQIYLKKSLLQEVWTHLCLEDNPWERITDPDLRARLEVELKKKGAE